MNEDDAMEAARLRVSWMTKIGMNGDAVESSLHHTRPHSLEGERYFLDSVEKLLEFEEARSPENLLKFAGESEGAAENVPA